jgi:hypothetical protein
VSADRACAADSADRGATFDAFMVGDGARLRRVLIAHFGIETGPDVAADAFAWAWEHWDEV